MEGSILLCWAAEAELASYLAVAFSSDFVSSIFVLVDLSLTLSLS